MIEKLWPLTLPAGFVNNGTAYQSKGRWYTGNFVRFFQNTIQPIGGWVARTTSGATITGTPNAIHAWKLNNGTAYLAIGTTSHLYVVNSGNVVFDITPTIPASVTTPYYWSLQNFGEYLIAVPGVSSASTDVNVFQWTGNTASAAAAVAANTNAPPAAYGVVVTPERFLVSLRGDDPVGNSGAYNTSGSTGADRTVAPGSANYYVA